MSQQNLNLDDLAAVTGGAGVEGSSHVVQFWMIQAYVSFVMERGADADKELVKNASTEADVLAIAKKATGFEDIYISDADVALALNLVAGL